MKNILNIFIYSLTLSLLISCNKDSHVDPVSTPFPEFESKLLYSPIDLTVVEYLEPLGCVNPPGHTLPTDHVYFYYNLPTNSHSYIQNYTPPVYAPQAGVINWILNRGNNSKVMVKVNSNFSYYLDHIVLDSTFALNSNILAGEKIGKTDGTYAIDLGVLNSNIILSGFINPARYGSSVNADSPYKYYTEPLRNQMYSLINRISKDKDGKIDYDIKGRLIGNWFHESVSVQDSNGPVGWPKEISIAPDSYDPSITALTFGGYIGIVGKFKIGSLDPDPSQVTVNSGKVTYHLMNYFKPGNSGIIAVQVLDDLRIKVEYFSNGDVNTPEFDSKAQIYTR